MLFKIFNYYLFSALIKIINILFYYLLTEIFSINYLKAFVIKYLIILFINYFFQNKFVFNKNLIISKFFIISILGLIIQISLLYIFVETFLLDHNLSNVIILLILSPLFFFILNKYAKKKLILS